MRSLLCLGIVLGLSGPVLAQTGLIQKKVNQALKDAKAEQKKAAEPKLADLLEEALKGNPDLRAADAKVKEAEAELHRTRIRVLNRIVALQAEIAAAKATVDEAKIRYENAKRLHDQKVISAQEVESATTVVQKAKAEQAKLEAELPYLLGKVPAGAEKLTALAFTPDGKVLWGGTPAGQVGMLYMDQTPIRGSPAEAGPGRTASDTAAETIRKVLDTPVRLDFKDVGLREVIEYLQGLTKGINFHLTPAAQPEQALTLKLPQPVPLGAALQLIEDECNVRCIIRDYGIVITLPDRAPSAAVGLIDFWKHRASTNPFAGAAGRMPGGPMGGPPPGVDPSPPSNK